MDNAALELIKLLKEVSPHVWEVLLKQVYTNAIMGVLFSVVLLIWMVASLYYAIKWKKELEREALEVAYTTARTESDVLGAVLLAAIPLILLLMSCSQWIPRLINPEFFALDYLLSTFKP